MEGVLEYARLENHKVQLNPTAMGGTALVDLIRSRFQENCDRNGIELVIENDLAIDQVFRSDFELAAQIIGVVANNACRYARGSDDPKVLIGLTDHDGGSLQIDVRDTGPGIERADVKRVFKPFRRGRGPTQAAQGGIGLGLALARNWAKILG